MTEIAESALDQRLPVAQWMIERGYATGHGDTVEEMLGELVLHLRDERTEELKTAFVAGCCAVLTWTHSGMPQDDLDEAGYDYAASVLK